MRKIVIVVFGFLPLWSAIVYVCIGSLERSAPPEYWVFAFGLVIVAVPVCGVTLAIAFVVLAIYNRISGNPSRKDTIAAISFLVIVLVIGAVGIAQWKAQEKRGQGIKADESLALKSACAVA
ncbi:MAG TPA: hypothetical protein VM532_13470 [Burkholderiales bacterium]|nr:hypothetical protein [Burkholderiales bacterium]